MRRASVAPWALLAMLPIGLARTGTLDASEQAGRVVAHSTTLAENQAHLELELADGATLSIAFDDGAILIDGNEVGSFRPGGTLAEMWRALVSRANSLPPHEVLARVRQLDAQGLTEQERTALDLVRRAVASLSASATPSQSAVLAGASAEAPPAPSQVPSDPRNAPVLAPIELQVDVDQLLERSRVYRQDLEVSPGEAIDGTVTMLRGDVTVGGRIRGDVIALDGDVILAEGGVVEGDVRLLRGRLVDDGGRVLGRVQHIGPHEMPAPAPPRFVPAGSSSMLGRVANQLMSLVATFVGLAFMGIGLMFFVPRQLDAVADTVWHSFWRSFLTGLFAQPLVLPALAIMLVGLTITIVGILVIPFAVAALAIALFLAVAGGFIAVARTVGEIYLRRRMAYGLEVGGWLTYRYLLYGLIGLLAIWLPPVFLGWVPVAGTIMTVSAAVFTWTLATAGLGATLLSRGGIRGTVVRRIDRALSDDRFWEPSSHQYQPPTRVRRR